jgi:chaperonin GroES
MKPVLNNVLVKPDSIVNLTAGGLIIPDTHAKLPGSGTVIAHGPGLPNQPTELYEGARVHYINHAGTPVQHEGEIHLMMKEWEILYILKEE